jgi:beta-lactamase regulating signal transducer with metallopeptidase domain
MNRSAGTGMMVFGLVLIVLGAILDFAVNVTASGFSINTVGLILLIVGIVAFLAGLVVVMTAGSRRSYIQEDVRQVPGGQQRVIEERDNLAS